MRDVVAPLEQGAQLAARADVLPPIVGEDEAAHPIGRIGGGIEDDDGTADDARNLDEKFIEQDIVEMVRDVDQQRLVEGPRAEAERRGAHARESTIAAGGPAARVVQIGNLDVDADVALAHQARADAGTTPDVQDALAGLRVENARQPPHRSQ